MKIIPHVIPYAEGSVEISIGQTKVLCTASVDEHLPKWLSASNQGWITAEYGMLPRSTTKRIRRDRAMSSGRTQEISRLIGRSLRASCDLTALSGKQIYVDCDVIQADGGTRVTSVTGGFIALSLAIEKLLQQKAIQKNPLLYYVSAVSVAILDNQVIVDPTAVEDQECSVDSNFVFSHLKDLVEIQGTAEKKSFSKEQLIQMLDQAQRACSQLHQYQSNILKHIFPLVSMSR